MPRYRALVDSHALEAVRDANNSLTTGRPSEYIPEGAPIPAGFTPVHTFEAADDDEARRYLRHIQDRGHPRDGSVGDAGRVTGSGQWRFRGMPHYIRGRADAMGVGVAQERSAQSCPQFRQITSILGQQCEFYHRCRRADGVARVAGRELQGVRAALGVAEREVATQALQLAASIDAMDLAYRAFGIDDVARAFALTVGIAATPASTPPADPPAEPTRRPKSNAGSK